MGTTPALGLCGDSDELQAQLRKSWIAATLVAPCIGPLGIALFRGTTIPRSAMIIWSICHVAIGSFTLLAFVADRRGLPRLPIRLDSLYRVGMVALFGALPWLSPAAAGTEPDRYVLAFSMVIVSAGGTLSVAQFAGRRRLLVSLMAAGTLSYIVAYVVNQDYVMATISLVWMIVCIVIGTTTAGVNVELVRLREYEELAARTDHLTGLLNRQGLFDELTVDDLDERALAIIDLDRFKLINDSFGHACGDHVLVEVARRLRASLPRSSAIGRIGGDEFAAIVVNRGSVSELRPTFEAVLAALEQPIDHGGRTLRVGASIGVTALDDCPSPSESFAQADLSMYRAKRESGNQLTFFDTSLKEELTRRVDLEQRFRRSLLQGSVTFHGQAIVQACDLQPVGIELLARWTDRDGTTIPPSDFIPIAEETGLTLELGRLALDQAAQLLARWSSDPDLADLEVSVNISPAHLATGLVDDVRARFPRPDRRLGIEFVETGLISSLRGDHQHLEALRETGARLVIDDFGVGYSSLSYLWDLPIDTLKIDKSFIDNVTDDPLRHRVVAAIASMADALGVPCVAEGVETEATVDALRELGIDKIQGFIFSRPEPLDIAEANLRRMLRTPAEPALN